MALPQLEKACAKVRADGYATDEAEYLDEVRCVAAPIRDQDQRVIAAIGVSAPASRFPKARQRAFARHVRDAAATISTALHVDPE